MDCSTPGFPVHHHLLELARFMSTESVMPSNHLFLFLSFTSCPASGAFLMSQLFASGSQSIGASALASILSMTIRGWFPLGLTSLISLQSKGFSRVFSSTTVKKHHSSMLSLLYGPTLTPIHDYWKNHSFDYTDPVWNVMSLLFNMLSRLVIAFLPRSKRLNFMAEIDIAI